MTKREALRKNLEKLQKILVDRNISDYDYIGDNPTEDEHRADK